MATWMEVLKVKQKSSMISIPSSIFKLVFSPRLYVTGNKLPQGTIYVPPE
jgi:hypothetical protein